MISAYLANIRAALQANRQEWFPMSESDRRERNLRLGREIGYGLGVFPEWASYAQTTYGQLIVANSLDSIGVVIDNTEWLDAIRAGIQKRKEAQPQ